MSERQQNITLKLAAKSYSLTIDSGSEEVYRLAEKMVNEQVTASQKRAISEFELKDYLAITAFSLAVEVVRLKQQGEVSSDELDKLAAIEQQLSDYLNSTQR